ncbi:zinc finger protein 2 homolog isoform X1 [Manduca sexta]|uniref:zinc finger protein 2 homolog isoform X1 n=1 Tax=Manduca sexta TaxID=7130 RepID=UPI0018902166|nr:zinc finger protein 2 homolog isoform X1 [Manduca sexta]
MKKSMNFFANSKIKVETQSYEFKQPAPGCSKFMNDVYLENFCVCCLANGISLVKLSSCSHSGFLKSYFLNEINFQKSLLCDHCHAILKKISTFKSQVECCVKQQQKTVSWIKLRRSNIVRASVNPEDVKPIMRNAVFIPESLPEIPDEAEDMDIKEEYISDESTKSAFTYGYDDDYVEEEIPKGKNFEKQEIPDIKLINRATTGQNIQSNTLHQCEICMAKFAEKEHMLNHQTKHNQPTPTKPKPKQKKTIVKTKTSLPVTNQYQCFVCNATFDAEAALDNHRQEHEKIRFARSDLYGKIRMVYLTREQLEAERDVMRATEYAMYQNKCHYCLKSFSLEDSLKLHMRRHDKKRGKYTCPVCKCVFNKSTSMKQHEELHWRRYQCMECGKKFIQDRKCIAHYNVEHADKHNQIDDYYACRHSDCNYIASDFATYRKHLREIHPSKVQCNQCNHVFPNAWELKCHKRNKHEETHQGPFKCHHCDKKYAGKNSLRNHVRTNHRLIPVLKDIAYCKTCKKQFKDKTSLVIHMRNNSKHVTDDGKKYTCDLCGAKFVTKTGIQSHVEMKHLPCTYQCDQCNKIVSCSRALRKHMKDHSEKPKELKQTKLCQICGKGFKHTPSLISHLNTHTGERPLQCTRCPATFAYKASLYTHNRIVHKVPKKGVK